MSIEELYDAGYTPCVTLRILVEGTRPKRTLQQRWTRMSKKKGGEIEELWVNVPEVRG